MNARTNIYGTNAETYAAAGLSVFPVDTPRKRPAVRGWQKATPQLARKWASVDKLSAAEGIGVVMGKPNGLTEVDVDVEGEAWLKAAVERFGQTPIIIRTASGKHKLWYRHSGERRIIRLEGQPIDILGKGFTIAPPSWHEDFSTSYSFQTGSLTDLVRLPTLRPGAFEVGFQHLPEAVSEGQRNNNLWRFCMKQARHCDDVEALLDVAISWNSAFPNPLSQREVERCARSAWRYEVAGLNFLGLQKPKITERDKIMDALLDQPDAYTFLHFLKRWHGNRQAFAIAPTAMSRAGSPPWSRHRIAKARDVLLERGHIEQLSAPDASKRQSGRYKLLVTSVKVV